MVLFCLNHYCKLSLLKKILSAGLITLFSISRASADAYDWLGGTSTDVTVSSNWWDRTTSSNGVPGVNDDVNIGVHSTYIYLGIFTINITLTANRMPVVAANTTWKSVTFGIFGPQTSYTYGVYSLLTLTVNTNTLTVSGNITQNHNASAQGSNFNYMLTQLLGTGTILCQGNFLVGDATTPANTVADVAKVASLVNQLTITGNLTLTANGNNQSGGNAGICYPYFSVEKGTTTLLKQLTFATANSPLADGYDTYNPPLATYPGYGKFTADNTASSPSTVELKYKTPIAPADKFYVYFTYGGNNGTVLYDDPTVENQTIYTSNEPSATTTLTYINTTAPPYYNLTFSGASTKVADKNSTLGTTTQGLVVGNNWTTSGGGVNLNTNNTTVTVTGSWTNAATVTQGTGNITIGGALTNNSGGTLSLSSANLSIAGNYTNNVGGVYTQGTGTTFFNGSGAQALVDNSTTGTLFKNVTFSGGGTATMSAGTNNINFAVSGTGILTMSNNSKLVAGTIASAGGASYLTLNSDANGCAAVAAITGTSSITGNVSAQRYLTGGSTTSGGRYVYRGYRIMSSPVNAGLVSGKYPYTLNYIATSAIVTGAKSSYSTVGGNPTLYAYSEDYAPSNASFTGGNFKGITDISTLTSPYTLAITSNGTSDAMYVGNGFLFFFRGDNIHNLTGTPSKTSYPFVTPESVVFTATGFLNQGSYAVNNWQTGSGLLYTTISGNSTVRGFNMVGNPYACTIDWETINSGGITLTNVDPSVYVLNPVTNQYYTYSASTHVGNPATFTGKIASGQGFFVKANNTGAAMTFNETAKSPTTVINAGSGNLMMGKPLAEAKPQLFRLRLNIDSLNYDDIAIGFTSAASSAYNVWEDSAYLPGSAPEGLAALSTDSIPVALSVNFLPLPKRIPQVIPLKVTAANSGRLTIEKTQLDPLPKIYELWLMDKYKKDSLDIRNNATYAFDIDKSDSASFGNNRFALVIRQNKSWNIHLLNFTALKATASVQLAWETENEENYTHFTVERSTDNAATFNVLGGFASTSDGKYTFTDEHPANVVNIYRIKIEDLNGTITYSKSIAIQYNSSSVIALNNNDNIRVYPNPAVGAISLDIKQPANSSNTNPVINSAGNTVSASQNTGSYAIKIISTSGRLMQSATATQASWHGDVSSLLPGTYIMQVVNNKDKSVVGRSTFVKL